MYLYATKSFSAKMCRLWRGIWEKIKKTHRKIVVSVNLNAGESREKVGEKKKNDCAHECHQRIELNCISMAERMSMPGTMQIVWTTPNSNYTAHAHTPRRWQRASKRTKQKRKVQLLLVALIHSFWKIYGPETVATRFSHTHTHTLAATTKNSFASAKTAFVIIFMLCRERRCCCCFFSLSLVCLASHSCVQSLWHFYILVPSVDVCGCDKFLLRLFFFRFVFRCCTLLSPSWRAHSVTTK